jgi:hypothetical protein
LIKIIGGRGRPVILARKPPTRSIMLARSLWLASLAALMATAYAFAEMPGTEIPGHVGQQSDAAGHPTMPGQDAFGTIQEIVRILETDPNTDWSKVNIDALRAHLIDMNEVTLNAVADQRALDAGVEITVTGEGRTADAIKRMVPAHVHDLKAMGWEAEAVELPNGVRLIVTSADPEQVTKLKALGFMGIMVQGSHHQMHHLMMAKGAFTH